MKNVIAERMTVDRAEGVVVFLIGMRINRWWKIHRWLPVMFAMTRMLRELKARPESGYLGGSLQPGLSVQYWRSAEALLAYAADRSGQHFPAWADFYRRVGTNGDVGIWHETFVVPATGIEAMYVNMPPTGLGRVSPLVQARGHRARARARLGLGNGKGETLPGAESVTAAGAELAAG